LPCSFVFASHVAGVAGLHQVLQVRLRVDGYDQTRCKKRAKPFGSHGALDTDFGN
jgi:hypothetical protein